jgi:hypothetical protein
VQSDYWQTFYQSADVARVPDNESAFARWVDERLPESAGVIDVGMGTARDTRFFARKSRAVAGLDAATAAVRRASELSEREKWDARFDVVDLDDSDSVGKFVANFDWTIGWHLYARFLLHAIDDEARANLWTLVTEVVGNGGQCWFEFRTAKDEDEAHVFGEHYRRFLPPYQVVDEVTALGLRAIEVVEGRGMAVYGQEDPWVARIRVGSEQ